MHHRSRAGDTENGEKDAAMEQDKTLSFQSEKEESYWISGAFTGKLKQ